MERKKWELQGEVKNIPIDLLVELEDNPNIMTDAEFNRLTKELDETGFIDPIQVVPLDDGRYQILGGHLRVKAAKVLGFESVPAVVLTDEKFKQA
ncbi:MAG: ParB N-terminal domain-containing protein [Candidatus Micrarchaeia archaeon]